MQAANFRAHPGQWQRSLYPRLRIPMATVLRMLGGMTGPEMLADCLDLQVEEIRECLRFAAVSAMERELAVPRTA